MSQEPQEFAGGNDEPVQEHAPDGPQQDPRLLDTTPEGTARPEDNNPSMASDPPGEASAAESDIDPAGDQHPDGDPTMEMAALEPQHDDEPTQEFYPADAEPTTTLHPHTDPEPTIALPPQSDQPYRAPAYQAPPRSGSDGEEQSYVRSPVFRPRGFEPPAAEAGAAGIGGAGLAGQYGPLPSETPDQYQARLVGEHEEAEAHAQSVQAEAARRREAAEVARQRSLGTITPDENAPATALPRMKRSTDKWLGSLGLLVLRLVLAAILAIRGYQMITDIPGTRDLLGQIGMPYLEYFPWALAIAHGLAALGLVFGLGVRVIGLCVAALGGCVLALVKWGRVPIFQDDLPGFVGELEVLMAAVGFLLFTIGSGGWGMDASWRHNREREKYGRN